MTRCIRCDEIIDEGTIYCDVCLNRYRDFIETTNYSFACPICGDPDENCSCAEELEKFCEAVD